MRRLFTIFVLMMIPLWGMAQIDSGRHFVKIVHSADGTLAWDSTGKVWHYDATQGEFVESNGQVPSVPEEPQPPQGEVILPPEIRCTDIHYGDITNFFREIEIGVDQRVEGSVTGGKNVIVKGLVTGDVNSSQTVIVEGTGEVRGNVTAREIRRLRGGKIIGKRTTIPIPEINIPSIGGFEGSLVGLSLTLLLAFIAAISIALAPKAMMRIVERIDQRPVKSFLWGLVVWFGMAPIFVLLFITIIGIPIALLIYPLVITATFLLALVSGSIYLGQKIAPRTGIHSKSMYLTALLGIGFFALAQIIIMLINFSDTGPLTILAIVLISVIAFVLLTMGLGAVLSTRFGIKFKVRVIAGAAPTGPITIPTPPPPPSVDLPPLPVPPPPEIPPHASPPEKKG